jgi:DNA-binding NtrC family response regulator
MCWEEKFRVDLYQRIKEGDTLRIPSLSERKGDLELLAKEFFSQWEEDQIRHHKDTLELKQSDFDKIVDLCIKHKFHGNVRGLKGILRSCFKRSLVDQRFNIERLEFELDIDKDQMDKYANESVGGIKPTSHNCSVTFDPREDKYKNFLERALNIYFTEVLRAAGGSPKRAIDLSKASRKTFFKYLPESQQVRNHDKNMLEDDFEPENSDTGEP